ncbi:MAG: maleylpyruvate isomerase family mycothiol-dependent enzyme [Acidimicrobiales bacterium]
MNQAHINNVATVPRIDHRESMVIAAAENAKFGALLHDLEPSDWTKPTDCDLWDARALAAHVVGSAASQASVREFVRQVRKGRPLMAKIKSPYWWDGMNQFQVNERGGLSTDQLLTEWAAMSTKALRARTRLPRPIAKLPLLNLPAPVGRQPLSYLYDIGFTRDVWMHRIDLSRATGRALSLDEHHDGRIVADIVAEWATTHGQSFTLSLTGPAGGNYRSGTDGEYVEIDAVEFCRTLAGREQGDGVLRHPLPL